MAKVQNHLKFEYNTRRLPVEEQPVVYFSPIFSGGVDTLGISSCHNTLFLPSHHLRFIIGLIRDLFVIDGKSEKIGNDQELKQSNPTSHL